MTTRWEVTRIWEGDTVAVLAPGPSLTPDVVDRVRSHRRIAVRRAFEMAHDADMLVALDGPTGSLDDAFWNDARDFKGLRICGTECELDALYAGMWYETVQIVPGHTIQIRNNALAAIRIAERVGAAKILLLGFDPERYEAVHAHTGFYGLVQGLEQMISELHGNGIIIERLDSIWT